MLCCRTGQPSCGLIAATEGSKCRLGIPHLSTVLPNLLHNCRQVVSSEGSTATDKASVGHSPSAVVEQVQPVPSGHCLSQTAPPGATVHHPIPKTTKFPGAPHPVAPPRLIPSSSALRRSLLAGSSSCSTWCRPWRMTSSRT